MIRKPDMLTRFERDDGGSVVVDWVVLSAAVMGIGVAVAVSMGSGVNSLGHSVGQEIGATDVAPDFSGSDAKAATHYFDLGIGLSPDNRREAWRQARMAAQEGSPKGYNYDPDFKETRYVDAESGMPVYESNDGKSYSIGGKVVSASDYVPKRNGASFMSAFNDYWGS